MEDNSSVSCSLLIFMKMPFIKASWKAKNIKDELSMKRCVFDFSDEGRQAMCKECHSNCDYINTSTWSYKKQFAKKKYVGPMVTA